MNGIELAHLAGLGMWLLGAGFLVANCHLVAQLVRFRRVRPTAMVTWPGRRPPYYGVFLGLGVVFGILLFVKIVVHNRPLGDAFGEGMMLLYYAYLWPLVVRIERGVYAGGVWTESTFVPYADIGGLSWREAPVITLLVISCRRTVVRPLTVPRTHYAAVRRVLRDKIANRDIRFTLKGFDLGADDRNVV